MQARFPPLSPPPPPLLSQWLFGEVAGAQAVNQMEARAQWDFLFFQDGVLCRGWETESGYRLTYQIVHWADCNAVGPSPDGGVGGTTACSGIILGVYYCCFCCCCCCCCAYVRNKTWNFTEGRSHKLCDRCNIRRSPERIQLEKSLCGLSVYRSQTPVLGVFLLRLLLRGQRSCIFYVSSNAAEYHLPTYLRFILRSLGLSLNTVVLCGIMPSPSNYQIASSECRNGRCASSFLHCTTKRPWLLPGVYLFTQEEWSCVANYLQR